MLDRTKRDATSSRAPTTVCSKRQTGMAPESAVTEALSIEANVRPNKLGNRRAALTIAKLKPRTGASG